MKTGTQGRILPPELHSEIVGFCSPSSLRYLPLVNKEFRFHSERLLYAHVAVRTSRQWQVGVFETLATDTTKAGYVKFLSLEFDQPEHPTDSLVLQRLVSAGPALKNLKDLRIRLRQDLRLENYTAGVFSMLCPGTPDCPRGLRGDVLLRTKVSSKIRQRPSVNRRLPEASRGCIQAKSHPGTGASQSQARARLRCYSWESVRKR
ncbi:hypothetical protein DFP72DRAFT_621646 [Ephemerocybe angulata]|uniref:F-box domain-containing protein n=1 Tax=Ephemerocybe angulata TaxID=980116 RepID=A0A8H6HI65_9AGAR|nr:hypothetical protein DFP72DRAFT_621646 [Tulosesus angulatus]